MGDVIHIDEALEEACDNYIVETFNQSFLDLMKFISKEHGE